MAFSLPDPVTETGLDAKLQPLAADIDVDTAMASHQHWNRKASNRVILQPAPTPEFQSPFIKGGRRNKCHIFPLSSFSAMFSEPLVTLSLATSII